jgi:hypothetical protein
VIPLHEAEFAVVMIALAGWFSGLVAGIAIGARPKKP